MRTSLYEIAFAALFAAMSAAAPARAYEQERSMYGARVRARTMPVRLRIGAPIPDVPEGGAAAVRRAAAAWQSPACTGLRFGEASGGEELVVEVHHIASGWSHGDTLAAYTDVKSDGRTGAVLAATIELNGAYRFTESDVVAEGALDLESVLLHEIGHAIGLAHSPQRQAIMRAGVKPGAPPRRELDADDVAGVCAIYPAASGSAPAAPEGEGKEPGGPLDKWSAVWIACGVAIIGASGALLFWKARRRSRQRARTLPRRA
jgi:hypothetical protein